MLKNRMWQKHCIRHILYHVLHLPHRNLEATRRLSRLHGDGGSELVMPVVLTVLEQTWSVSGLEKAHFISAADLLPHTRHHSPRCEQNKTHSCSCTTNEKSSSATVAEEKVRRCGSLIQKPLLKMRAVQELGVWLKWLYCVTAEDVCVTHLHKVLWRSASRQTRTFSEWLRRLCVKSSIWLKITPAAGVKSLIAFISFDCG